MNMERVFRPNTALNVSSNVYGALSTSAISVDTDRYVIIDGDDAFGLEVEDPGKYSVYDVADWFLKKGEMTHKKLQKLCYYAQAWTYALKKYRLENTDFQAWIHGPVSPALWEKFKSYGYDTIKIKGKNDTRFDNEDIELLEDVWDTYGHSTGNALEALSHRELPWIEARRGYEPNDRCNVVISPKTMAAYYKSIYIGD